MARPLPLQANQQWVKDKSCASSDNKNHSRNGNDLLQSIHHESSVKDSRAKADFWFFVVMLVLLLSIEETIFFFIKNTQNQTKSTTSFHSARFQSTIRYTFIDSPDTGNPSSRSKSESVPRSPFRFVASPDMLLFSEEESLSPVDSMYITSPSEVQQYRWKHRDRIPLDEPIVYIITPTTSKRGLTQLDNLMSFGQTLKLDGNIYWVIVEDTDTCCSSAIRALLHRLGLPFAHVVAKTNQPKGAFGHRGVDQRNRALELVESLVQNQSQRLIATSNMTSSMAGVVYFGDDDNTYDLRLFPALRETKTVGMLPVGLVGAASIERCVVNHTTGRVISISSGYMQQTRRFPIDMAGFAFHTDLLLPNNNNNNNNKRPRLQRKVRFNWMWPGGTLETRFMQQLVEKRSDVNPLGDNCTKLYVWHTRPLSMPFKQHGDSQPVYEGKYIHDVGTPPPPPVFPYGKLHHRRFPNESFDDYTEFAHIASRVGGVVDAEPRDRSL